MVLFLLESTFIIFSSSFSLYLYNQILNLNKQTQTLNKKISFLKMKINTFRDKLDAHNEFLSLCDEENYKINIIQLISWEPISDLLGENVINKNDLYEILKIYDINIHNKLEKQITMPIFTSVINHIYEDFYIYWEEMN